MAMLRKVSNRMGNAMSTCYPKDPRWKTTERLSSAEVGRMSERGFIFWSELYHRYRLTDEGVEAYEKWLRNRIENIRIWSRKDLLFYEHDMCTWDSYLLKETPDGGVKFVNLEPWIVRRMIDDGILQYESATNSWTAPVKSDTAAVQEDRRSVCA